jgi:hypothetical protein
MTNNIQEKANFIVVLDHEGGKGYLRHRNKVAVFERISGDTVVSKSTLSLGGSVQEACDAIVKYWADNGARLSGQAVRDTPPPPAPAPELSMAIQTTVGEVLISSSPSTGDIDIDGAFVGNTPSTLSLAPGDHVIRITRKGFQPYEKKLHISGGKINLNAELEPVQP